MLSGIKASVIVLLVSKPPVSQSLINLFTIKNAIWCPGVVTHLEINLWIYYKSYYVFLSSSALVVERSCLYGADY